MIELEQDRLNQLLIDTVSLLCKNGLTFRHYMKIEGVIGITVDDNVFIVHINERDNAAKEEGIDNGGGKTDSTATQGVVCEDAAVVKSQRESGVEGEAPKMEVGAVVKREIFLDNEDNEDDAYYGVNNYSHCHGNNKHPNNGSFNFNNEKPYRTIPRAVMKRRRGMKRTFRAFASSSHFSKNAYLYNNTHNNTINNTHNNNIGANEDNAYTICDDDNDVNADSYSKGISNDNNNTNNKNKKKNNNNNNNNNVNAIDVNNDDNNTGNHLDEDNTNRNNNDPNNYNNNDPNNYNNHDPNNYNNNDPNNCNNGNHNNYNNDNNDDNFVNLVESDIKAEITFQEKEMGDVVWNKNNNNINDNTNNNITINNNNNDDDNDPENFPDDSYDNSFYDQFLVSDHHLFDHATHSHPHNHRRNNDKPRPYTCQYPDCGREYIRSDHLVRHQRSFHGKKWGIDSQVVYYCSYCSKHFYKQFSLNKHLLEVHNAPQTT